MTDPVDDDEEFDFEQECIKVYRGAKTDDVKIKALSLIAKVQPAKAPVKPDDDGGAGEPAALAAQRKMNGGS